MTTHEIAHQLAEMVRQQAFKQARELLYAPDAQCQEADCTVCQGLNALEAKQIAWQQALEQIYSVQVSESLVNGNTFSLAYTWDLQYKGQPRHVWHEIGTYLVQHDRIVREQYVS